MNLKETYNKIAKEWHRDHQDDSWWVEGTNSFISFLKKGDAVLDVGCGAGTKSKYLIEKGLEVTGIDFSEKMIEIAKKEVPEGAFEVLDLKDIEKLRTMFNGVLMQAVLLHIPKKEAQEDIQNIASKLKVGGYFYIAIKERRPNGPEEEIKTENDYGYDYQRFFSYFTTAEIKKYFTNASLKIIYKNIAKTGKTNWIQIIGQKV